MNEWVKMKIDRLIDRETDRQTDRDRQREIERERADLCVIERNKWWWKNENKNGKSERDRMKCQSLFFYNIILIYDIHILYLQYHIQIL